MKSLFTIILSCSISILFAQKDTVKLREISRQTKNVVTDRPPQALYFLIGGSGPILSVNYDRRLQKKVNGIGFAAGLGFYGISGISIFSVPVSINYLIGRSTHFMEVAAGTTFISAAATDIFDGGGSGSVFIHHINAGYRYQPTRGGFFFRGGISPLFSEGQYITSYYVGFGHNF
jgi:hypothetical protein